MSEENENLNLDNIENENSKIWDDELDIPLSKMKEAKEKEESKDKIILIDEQKEELKRLWNEKATPPPIYELTEKIFGKKYDARGLHGRAIKKALSEMDLKPPERLPPKPKIELTEEQKEYIANNIQNMKCVEMARELFNKPSLTALNAESMAITEYVKTLPQNIVNSSFDIKEGIDLEEYKPPKTMEQAFKRVNSYVQNGITEEQFKQNTKIQECLKSLTKFCHVYRYLNTMEMLTDTSERKLFESSFIRFIWDKPDLTEEEIDMYLNLCGDIVDLGRLKKELALHSEWLQQQSDDSDGKKLSMGLVENIGKIREDIDANQKRQVKLLENLQGKRSDRINTLVKSNASILQLVEMWKEEKTRKRALQLAKQKKMAVKDEINKIDTMDEFTAQIFGLNRESFEP